MRGRAGGPGIIFDAMMRQVLGGGNIGHGENVRSCNASVVVLGSPGEHSPSLNLIIATCQVFRHLRTLEKTDDPRIQLAFPDFD